MLSAVIVLSLLQSKPADALVAGFQNPPLSARPHTWWHWMNGMVTKEGITADLEAMKQVGIGGAQMFSVDQGIPAGPAKYMGPLWRELTQHAVREASRLGLELCTTNCAGWSSSGGPWITQDHAMQVIAWSQHRVKGPRPFSEFLPQPEAPVVYSHVPVYKDIAVFAYRTPPKGDVPPKADNFVAWTGAARGDQLQLDLKPVPAGMTIPASGILNITEWLGPDGRLTWNVPEGDWTILRMGHVPTGKNNHPAPPEGEGPEVDKLSREALDAHWAGMMAKVLKDAGPLAGKVLNNSLIDSYEVGSQNWTPKMREDFRRLRGYDPLPYLPVVAGRVVESKEVSERFLWDLRRTIADLYAANYYGYFAELCRKNGILSSVEPYGNGGFDNIQSGSKVSIPMGEFWLGGGTMETVKLASSIGHVYGRPVIGAESFTGDDVRGRWLEDPYALKALGDLAFCTGVNRYIFHRYAMQPWQNLRPGMTMGPWGTHLERTQTWWTEAATWLRYVARCQYLLQSGRFVADAVYYYGENAPLDLPAGPNLKPPAPAGYDYDGCDAAAVLSMSVRNGRVVVPSGMSYRVLVLPDSQFTTPQIAKKVRELTLAGATVYGTKPKQSPSLQGYPSCDSTVRTIANEIWGSADQLKPGERRYGKGRVVWGKPLADVFAGAGLKPDFDYKPRRFSTKLIDIHRVIGGNDVYFVSNQKDHWSKVECLFRSTGKVPELWNAETGSVQDAPAYSESGAQTRVPLTLGPAESVFVVFRKPAPRLHLTALSRAGTQDSEPKIPPVTIERARYEAADGRGADVTDRVRAMVANGQVEIPATNEVFGDPIPMVVKRLTIEYRVGGKAQSATVGENESVELIKLPNSNVGAPGEVVTSRDGKNVTLTAWSAGKLTLSDSLGHAKVVSLSAPSTIDLSRGWHVTFPPKLGAPPSATFDELVSWPARPETGIRYFSGSATYSKEIHLSPSFAAKGQAVLLDLGHVKNFATVTVNGHKVATLWKPPFTADISPFVKPGANLLEVKVTNLWPNRLIGDEQLPPDVEWTDGHLKEWPAWLAKGQPRPPTGRIAFATWKFWSKDSPLLESGLMGPVTLKSAKPVAVHLR